MFFSFLRTTFRCGYLLRTKSNKSGPSKILHKDRNTLRGYAQPQHMYMFIYIKQFYIINKIFLRPFDSEISEMSELFSFVSRMIVLAPFLLRGFHEHNKCNTVVSRINLKSIVTSPSPSPSKTGHTIISFFVQVLGILLSSAKKVYKVHVG